MGALVEIICLVYMGSQIFINTIDTIDRLKCSHLEPSGRGSDKINPELSSN